MHVGAAPTSPPLTPPTPPQPPPNTHTRSDLVVRSEGELDQRLGELQYRIEHESITLREERTALADIKKLESQRERVRAGLSWVGGTVVGGWVDELVGVGEWDKEAVARPPSPPHTPCGTHTP